MRLLHVGDGYAVEVDRPREDMAGNEVVRLGVQPFRVEVRWDACGVWIGVGAAERPNDPRARRTGYGGELDGVEALAVAGLLAVAAVGAAAEAAAAIVRWRWRWPRRPGASS